MPDLVAEMLGLFVYGPLVVLLHELGHAGLARAGGYRLTSFGIGLGKPLWRTRLKGGVVLHVDRWVFAGGACVAIPIGPPTARRAWFHAGGLLAQLVLGLVLLLLPDQWFWIRVAQFNLLVALTNAIPWRFAGFASDGWHLVDALSNGSRSGSEVLPQRRYLARLAAREHAAGSPLGALYAELCIAWIDLIAGRPEATAVLFRSDPDESALDPWVDMLYHYVHAEWHRLEGRPLAALRIARVTRYALEGDVAPEGDALMALAEARALVDLDACAQAQRVLARLAGIGGPIGRQGAATHLAASLADDTDAVEYATWRVTRSVEASWLDPADTVCILWEVADRLVVSHRVRAARGARDAARHLARRTLAVAAPEDRPPLLRRLGEPAAISRRQERSDQS